MQMKRLTLEGFKSFLRKTEILFPEGTSAIVGPNGCGKSNVVDAIRWVLGEQSPKRLRGKNMEEILFSGSEHFPPASMARVSLMLEQKERAFPYPYSEFEELCVERIFFRTGESEYRINRMPVRLKDIVDLFADTGTGTRAYSIIEQGYIGEIISAGPEQRRLFIEEAAGIVKYKRRKNSAIRKMEATQENLRHIEAILFEIKRQMNALNRQAQKARRYKRVREEIRRLDCTLAFRQYRSLLDQERAEETSKGQKKMEAARLVSELSREEADIEQIKTDLLGEKRESEQKQGKRLEYVQELNRLENKQIYTRQSYQDLERKLEEDQRQLADTRERLLQADREERELAAKIHELSNRDRWIDEVVGEEKKKYGAVVEQEKHLQTKVDSVKESVFVCMTKKADLHNRQLGVQEKQKGLAQRKIRGEQEIYALQSENETLLSKKEELERTLKGWKQKRGLSLMERMALEVHQRHLKAEFDRITTEIEELQQSLNRKRSRLISLQEFQENYEGYQEGVRAIMRRRKEEERLKKGIRGMVADVLETEPEFETALESVLGDKLQYIIVEEQEYSLQAIEYLKAQTLGRGSFIPLRLRGGPNRDTHQEPALGRPLIDVVKVKDDYQEIAEHLLADVVLVPDLKTGLDLWNDNGHFKKIVSREGDLIDPDGVISGGKTNGSGNTVLKTKREIKELERETDRLEEEYRRKRETADGLVRKIRFNEADLDRVQQNLYRLDMEILRGEKDAQQLSEHWKRNLQRLTVLEAEASELEAEIEELGKEERKLAKKEEALVKWQASREELLSELNSRVQEWAAEREMVQDELNRLEVELQLIREKRTGLFAHKRQIEQRIQTIRTYLLEKERESGESVQRMQSLEMEMEKNDLRVKELEQMKCEVEEKLAFINARIHSETLTLQQKEEVSKGLRGKLEETRHLQDAIQLRLVEIDLKKKNVQDQLWQRHGMDLKAGPDFELSEEEDEEIHRKLEKLHAAIERIGEVNPTAIEEFENLQKRHQFYKNQYEDLRNSLESLRRLIQRISRITKARFLEAFGQINGKFQKIFPQLFKGGKAFLQLDSPDDPLESGVAMVAQPPGKRLQNINLLSGGEKSLAALALVIAIFQYKPSPFCVLDEVDAALDDVNVLRFTEILREISRFSQFILITHNKQTMEIADQLYGITMESPGISQIVSVRVSEPFQSAR